MDLAWRPPLTPNAPAAADAAGMAPALRRRGGEGFGTAAHGARLVPVAALTAAAVGTRRRKAPAARGRAARAFSAEARKWLKQSLQLPSNWCFGARWFGGFGNLASPQRIKGGCFMPGFNNSRAAFCFFPTAESFGVSAHIGSAVVRGKGEVRFHQGSTRFHQGSTKVPPGFHQGSTGFCEGCGVVRGGFEVRFHEGSTRVRSTRFCEGCGVVHG